MVSKQYNFRVPRLWRVRCSNAFLLPTAIALVTPVVAQQSLQIHGEFQSMLQEIYRRQTTDETPDSIVNAYIQLIEQFRDHPQVAEPMFHLASYYRFKELSDQKAIYWLRKAIATTTEDSWVWSRARLLLARQLYSLNDFESGVREARGLLEAVEAKPPEQSLTQAQMKLQLMIQCLAEENLVGAEKHFRDLLDWKLEQHAAQDYPFEMRVIEGLQLQAARHFLQRIPYGPGTKAGKAAWMKQFVSDYPDRAWLQEMAGEMQEQIAIVQESRSALKQPDVTEKSTVRTLFLASNIIAVLVLAAFVLRNHIHSRREATNAL